MKKHIYLDLAEIVFDAYSAEDIRAYTKEVEKRGIYEHGFPRLTASLGILLAHGKAQGFKSDFKRMMTLCCAEVPHALQKNGGAAGNDFSVKELVLCLTEAERAHLFPKSVTDGWRAALAKINPYGTYTAVAVKMQAQGVHVHNWAAFSAASEQLRKHADLCADNRFIDEQIQSQLTSFDKNGMYRDPGEPLLYDFMTRLQLGTVLYFGYDGKYRAELEALFEKSADLTLDMQSVTGEIPFGGRSAQFLFNEACFAALCEFYAWFFAKRKNAEKAAQFKGAARLAVRSIAPWLVKKGISHVKNRFAPRDGFGCESYAYFDKYMITTVSNLYLAYIMADDATPEGECPALCKNGIFETSEHFHKVMCRFGEYFAEIETNADAHYDANGLGRVHKRGAPPAICLSVPFAKEPAYRINGENPRFFSVAARLKDCGGTLNTADPAVKYTLSEKRTDCGGTYVKFLCTDESGAQLEQSFSITARGVFAEAIGKGTVEIAFPLLAFDGEEHPAHIVTDKSAQVLYEGWRCTFSSDGALVRENTLYENRNGAYAGFCATGENRVSLLIEIDKP